MKGEKIPKKHTSRTRRQNLGFPSANRSPKDGEASSRLLRRSYRAVVRAVVTRDWRPREGAQSHTPKSLRRRTLMETDVEARNGCGGHGAKCPVSLAVPSVAPTLGSRRGTGPLSLGSSPVSPEPAPAGKELHPLFAPACL